MSQVLSAQTRFSPRRSAFEIRMDILKVVAEGSVKPTHIMYRSNTSWIVLHKNLESLLASGFMQQSGECSRTEYGITETGKRVLHDYVDLVEKTSSLAEVLR
ncbi:MAG TPA: winged helix-turn-helix domain-containing protein [Nitrososphaerales archaeon]|nr:winged helix-turn-helix domain-containing protein [Nitrososphaerales archaeon]